jgi:hypothetical protein
MIHPAPDISVGPECVIKESEASTKHTDQRPHPDGQQEVHHCRTITEANGYLLLIIATV